MLECWNAGMLEQWNYGFWKNGMMNQWCAEDGAIWHLKIPYVAIITCAMCHI
jgi:hypothetical protein